RWRFCPVPYPRPRPLAQELLDGALHDRAVEEVRVHVGVEPHRIREDEVLEVRLGDQPVLYELPCLGSGVSEIWHVPVRYVRPKDRIEPGAEGVELRIERAGVHWVIRFAAEIEVRHEEVADIFRLLDAAGCEVVDFRGPVLAFALKARARLLPVDPPM